MRSSANEAGASDGDARGGPSQPRTRPDGARLDQRVWRLIDEVLDVPTAERRFALEARETDSELIARVLALLEEEDERFLAQPPVDRMADLAVDHPEVPGFEVLDVLGEGGMGRVFRGVQTSTDRRPVAIKMIRAAVPGDDLIRRFEAERQALSRLNHPAIAQLYGAGTAKDGRHFVAMEFVDGQPITRFCDGRRLDLRARLELFVEVCRGVEHAHRRQLLHRDLKPSNILVTASDDRPIPKIIDFGIVRTLDTGDTEEHVTGVGILGTPAYMSPEAVLPTDERRDLDTRTDVYSLGVVLYELLVGIRPHDGKTRTDPMTMIQRILNERIVRPSRRWEALDAGRRATAAAHRRVAANEMRRTLAGDLDWITMKALDRDQDQRYGSVAALADDIERCMRHEPVVAGPPTARYRVSKFVRRNRVLMATAALAALMLVAGFVITSVALLRARSAAQQEIEARLEAEAVSGFLTRIFEAGAVDQQGVRRPPDEVSVLDLLERGRDEVDAELRGQPVPASRLRHTLASAYHSLGVYEEPLALLEASRAALADLEPTREIERQQARLELLAGEVLVDLARPEEALEALKRAEALSTAFVGPEQTLVRARVKGETAMALNLLARFREAERHQHEAISLVRSIPESPRGVLVTLLSNLGYLYFGQERWPDAAAQYVEALELARREYGAQHANTALILDNLAGAMASQGQLDDAAPRFAEALAIRRAILPENHPQLAISLNNLGALALDRERPAESETHHRQALAIRRAAFGDVHPATAWSHEGLARALEDLGRREVGATHMETALDIRRQVFPSDHPVVRRSLRLLGNYHRRGGDLEGAVPYYREALAARQAPAGEPDRRRAEIALSLAEVLIELGEPDETPALVDEAEARLPEPAPKELVERIAALRRRPS